MTMEQKLEEMRLENEKKRLSILYDGLQGLLIVAGMGVVCTLFGYLWTSSMDSELVDAIQECGYITLLTKGEASLDDKTEMNKSVDECRAKVFEHFQTKG